MKRLIPVILLIVLPLLLLNFDTSAPTDWYRHKLNGRVKSCKTTCYKYNVLNSGRVSLTKDCIDYAGDCYHLDSYFKYNKKGYVIEAKEYAAKWEPEKSDRNRIYKRDDENKILSSDLFDDSNKLISREIIEYDNDRNPCRVSEYDGFGHKKSSKEFHYDEKRRPIEVLHYDAAGVLTNITDKCFYLPSGEKIIGENGDTLMFNVKGELLMEYGVFDDGSSYKNIHEYNSNGERERVVFMIDNKIVEVKNNPYQEILTCGTVIKADENDNWIIRDFPSPFSDKAGSVIIREIEYY